MAATILNVSGVEDLDAGYKTYYIRITTDDGVYFKIGRCAGSVKKRYLKEPSDTTIEILKLWVHKTEDKAMSHEERLLKSNPGDRPFIGKCGPLTKGGNTETYSHDVIGGEKPPFNYIVRMYSMRQMRLHAVAYPSNNPRNPYMHLHGTVRYMDYSFGPEDTIEGSYLQVPSLSHPKSVTIATEEFLTAILERGYTGMQKKHAKDALDRYIIVYDWADYSKMSFEAPEFKVGRYDDWV